MQQFFNNIFCILIADQLPKITKMFVICVKLERREYLETFLFIFLFYFNSKFTKCKFIYN